MEWSKWKPREQGAADLETPDQPSSQPPNPRNPYADWFWDRQGDARTNAPPRMPGREQLSKPFSAYFTAQEQYYLKTFVELLVRNNKDQNDNDLQPSMRDLANDMLDAYGTLAAPNHSAGSVAPDDTLSDDNAGQLRVDPESLADDTVIMGVIDTGIALGHRRTRFPDGTTRILSAWQQSAPRPGQGDGNYQSQAAHLPFGRELMWDDLNALLKKHSGDDIENGWLDEDGFNRAAGLVDHKDIFGHRELDVHTAHGTHVLDRAVGCDPHSQDDADFRDKVRIVAVNLPSREIVGLSGSFLELYVLFGILRIINVADTASYAKTGKYGQFPILINLSFGKQAGPRDGWGPIGKFLRELNRQREASGQLPVYMTLPAGNDNLERGSAYFTVQRKQNWTLDWRLVPEDQSSNYLEVWSEPIHGEYTGDAMPLEIGIARPDGVGFEPSTVYGGQYREFGDSARVYCDVMERQDRNDKPCYRVRYLICAAPTLDYDSDRSVSLAGVWTLTFRVRDDHHESIRLYANVQTDQSPLPGRAIGLRGYFEDDKYEKYDETTGRHVDAYYYSGRQKPKRRERSGKVKRHNTMNAIGLDREYTVVVGGYRATDGLPADYSSTGLGAKVLRGMGAPTVAGVTDDGAAHFGILAAGAKDGSVTAMRGTSFACAQIAREIATWMITNRDDNPKGWIERQYQELNGLINMNEARFDVQTDPEKSGWGRYPQREYKGFSRTGEYPDP